MPTAGEAQNCLLSTARSARQRGVRPSYRGTECTLQKYHSPMPSYRHTILFDDSLHPSWRVATSTAALVDHRYNVSVKGFASAASCSRSLRVKLTAPRSFVRLRAHALIREAAPLSLQLWAQGSIPAAAQCGSGRSSGWSCSTDVCVSMRRSSGPEISSVFVPLCAFGGLTQQHTWRKFVVPATAFSSHLGGGFDEIVLLAGGDVVASGGVELLLDDIVLMSAAKPPPLALPPLERRPSPSTAPGWCEYMAPYHPEGDAGRGGEAAARELPACRVANGDHLRGRWVRNCDPDAIRRPDRYAYGASLGATSGSWDYRLCFRLSYAGDCT